MGTSLHAGMAEYWRGRQGHEAQPRAVAQLTLVQGWQTTAEQSFEGMSALLDRVLDATIAFCAQHMRTEDALLIEQPLEADGHTTPDLVTRGFSPEHQMGLIVTDFKYHHEVQPQNIVYRLADPDHSHQFQHYAWRVGEYLREPVRLVRALHVVGLPRVIVRETNFTPSPEQTQAWLKQARRKWHLMHMMRLDPDLVYRNEMGCKPFGDKYPCPMWEACWVCHSNEEQMAQFYVKEKQDGL